VTSLSDTVIWTTMIIAGLGTFALRFSFIALLGKVDEVPPLVEQALRLVPAAVLAALVTPALTRTDGELDIFNEKLLAGIVAAVVAFWTKNVLATLVSGMVALWVLQAL